MPTGIETEKRSHVDTATAARWLNRKPQTLRGWACLDDGPLRPRRIGGRLAWAVADIRALLEVGLSSVGPGLSTKSQRKKARDT
nr:hypothetical protein [uncultured Duganella sp.]